MRTVHSNPSSPHHWWISGWLCSPVVIWIPCQLSWMILPLVSVRCCGSLPEEFPFHFLVWVNSLTVNLFWLTRRWCQASRKLLEVDTSHSCSAASPPWFLLSKSNHNLSCKCCDPRICIFCFSPRSGPRKVEVKSKMDIDVSKKVSKPICCPKHIKSFKFPTTRTSNEEWQNKQRVEPQLNHCFSNFVATQQEYFRAAHCLV